MWLGQLFLTKISQSSNKKGPYGSLEMIIKGWSGCKHRLKCRGVFWEPWVGNFRRWKHQKSQKFFLVFLSCFSTARGKCFTLNCACCMLSRFRRVWLCATLWTVVHQAPLSLEFYSKNIGVGCHFLLQGIFLTQESIWCLLCLLHWQMGSLPLVPLGKPYSELWQIRNSFWLLGASVNLFFPLSVWFHHQWPTAKIIHLILRKILH